MKIWMRKPKKTLDIYRLAISTIFIFLPVLLVALYSIILIKLKKQAHPGEQSANAEEQRTRRNRNVLKMAIAIVLAFFRWTPYVINELISLYLLTVITHSCNSDIYAYLSSILISAFCVINLITRFLFNSNHLRALRDFWLSLELGKFNYRQETYNCESSGFLLQ